MIVSKARNGIEDDTIWNHPLDFRKTPNVGLATGKTGISVHILGIKDKKYLAKTFGKKLGKAKVTGYCINFKTLKDIDVDVLEAVIRFALETQD